MKIPPSSRPTIDRLAPDPAATRPAPRRPAELAEPRESARLSPAGALVSGLRAEAAAHGVEGDVRPEVVERMRQEIADGRLGAPEDVERAIDALLREL